MVMPRSCSSIVVGLGGALVHGAEAVRGAGVVEDVLGGRRLAGVDVGDDAEVANLAQVDAFVGGHGPSDSPRSVHQEQFR